MNATEARKIRIQLQGALASLHECANVSETPAVCHEAMRLAHGVEDLLRSVDGWTDYAPGERRLSLEEERAILGEDENLPWVVA